MRTLLALALCQLGLTITFLTSSLAGAETRVEQGREVLKCVRAMHLMADFGIEALEPDEQQSCVFAWKFSSEESTANLGDDDWNYRLGILQLERLGRDLIAGKAIPEADQKMLEEHFRLVKDPTAGLGLTKEEIRKLDDLRRDWLKRVQQVTEKLAAGESLNEDELALAHANWASFRSGDQLHWEVIDLPLDIPKMIKAYSSSLPKDQHAIRCLIGIRGKADSKAVEFIERIMRDQKPIERYDAAIAAGKMRPPADKLITALKNCLSDPDPRVARAAVRSLLSLNAKQSAAAMLRRLKQTVNDKEGALLDRKLGFGFDEYDIMNSHIGFRYDLPTELMYALGRFHHREARPLLWDIVQGRGKELWQHEGIYELDHGGVAFEAIVAIGNDPPADVSRRALAMKSATVDALGAGANTLGESGEPADIPTLTALMSRLDQSARSAPRFRYKADRAMSRATFAAERLLFFADSDEPRLPELRQALVSELSSAANGPFGESMIAALEYFDPDHVEVTAMALAADTKAEPNARRIAIEILGKSKKLEHVQPLLALFEDDGNATNGPVGRHAALATSRILADADHADPRVATLKKQVADKLERTVSADP